MDQPQMPPKQKNNGGAGIYIKYPNGERQSKATPTGLHCSNYKIEEAIIHATRTDPGCFPDRCTHCIAGFDKSQATITRTGVIQYQKSYDSATVDPFLLWNLWK